MKATILYLLIFFSAFTSCNSQEVNQKKNKNEKKKPHEEVTVNRKYDENGNLIEFDSTYTSYYSSFEGDTIELDSLLNNFPSFFNDEFFKQNYNLSSSFFFNDSLIRSHFFHDDFFEKQFWDQNESMLRMMRQMDSIKNSFFEEQGKKH